MQARGLGNDTIGLLEVGAGMPLIAYQDDGFVGAAKSFGPGRYDIGQLTIGNDQASSILVPSGFEAASRQNRLAYAHEYARRDRIHVRASPCVGLHPN